jgi:hypothetical protein
VKYSTRIEMTVVEPVTIIARLEEILSTEAMASGPMSLQNKSMRRIWELSTGNIQH